MAVFEIQRNKNLVTPLLGLLLKTKKLNFKTASREIHLYALRIISQKDFFNLTQF